MMVVVSCLGALQLAACLGLALREDKKVVDKVTKGARMHA